ncbi:hypothetical protein HanOQP8_Chr04g0130371 [Helianthus annuus]|uniref:uncharacterized protein LOC118491703 n=1 Tax=Helianthus annuus TaxID=4232 RepID=UPI0016532246|nr:uncharacterized protein LOC118491703 [Helianthus annuus]KAJ0586589.1 hypothetical protein HanIR_Chr04g0153591 [Helianthus annuus]KAJ0755985.1 hypothetical protein HanLR1_Chr04g0121981 [Helianthus annuus]KAJ0759768.1 hypothetical protein HanOQP8_Chr04g0130371 [Helianthus annuus]
MLSLKRFLCKNGKLNWMISIILGWLKDFERLGWLAALTFNNKDNPEVYQEEIIEWMSTLRKVEGDNHPWDTKLIGTVNKTEVTMSMKSLLKIAPFDTLPQAQYETHPDNYICLDIKQAKGPEWAEMLETLFEVPLEQFSESMPLKASDLKPLPRLISKIFTWNIISRRSDKAKVRHCDVRVLYALVTGKPIFPFRQLIMLNVWEAHEKSKRAIIPHCRLLSCLLKNANVISKRSTPRIVPFTDFCRSQLGKGEFAYKETVTHFVLHDMSNRRVHEIAKDVVMGENDGGPNGEEREYDHLGRNGPINPYPGRHPAYRSWNSFQRAMWDRSTMEYEEARQWRSEQRELLQLCVYQQERNYQKLFDYAEQVRHHEDYRAGLNYFENVSRVDYSTLPPWDKDDENLTLPYYPRMPFPSWRSIFAPAQVYDQGESSSNEQHMDPYTTRPLARGVMESFFGPNRGPN